MTNRTFQVGDRVRCLNVSNRGRQYGIPGDLGTVVQLWGNRQAYIRLDSGVTSPMAMSRFELVGFKIGDRVSYQPAISMSTYSKRGSLGTVKALNWGVTVAWDRGNNMGDVSTENPKHLAHAKLIQAQAPVSAPPVTVAPGPTSKVWIIVLRDEKGTLLPAVTPKTYSSERQAHAVAKSMAERHRDQTFMVFEATGFVHLPVVQSAEVVRL